MTTLIMTAKLNDVDPPAWLADVLGQIADIPQGRLKELLPWNWEATKSASGRLICSRYAAVLGVGLRHYSPSSISGSIRGRALERDDLIPGAALRLERNGPTLVQVRCVVADRKRIAVQNKDTLPGLPL